MMVKKELAGLKDNFIVLMLVNPKKYTSVTVDMLRYVTKKCMSIYITVNRPYENLTSMLKKRGVNTDKMLFIDCITKTGGGNFENKKNCLLVASPKNLTDIGIVLEDTIKSFGKACKFLFLDSLSTLLIYNNKQTVLSFCHFLSTKIRVNGMSGAFISIESDTDKNIVSIISQFCDKVIKVK
jgi:hypothetical protein